MTQDGNPYALGLLHARALIEAGKARGICGALLAIIRDGALPREAFDAFIRDWSPPVTAISVFVFWFDVFPDPKAARIEALTAWAAGDEAACYRLAQELHDRHKIQWGEDMAKIRAANAEKYGRPI